MDSEYIITKISEGQYDVYKESTDSRYSVTLQPRRCNCPHWYYRLRHSRAKCKHIEMVLQRGAWNE